MQAVLSLYSTTVGKKIVMAVTGLLMTGWLFVHMVGNLQVFLGEKVFNDYAALLQGRLLPVTGELLWVMRGSLLVIIGLHIASIVQLASASRTARAGGYQGGWQPKASTFASRSLRLGGIALFAFIVFHLMDLTMGVAWVHPTWDHLDAHGNLLASMRNPLKLAFYIIGNVALGLHLAHGISSTFQTLGLNAGGDRRTARLLSGAALLIPIGNIVIALAAATGIAEAVASAIGGH
jgi:succinate dehydrogenase / fumarate reductase cytochrome b subunit